MLARRRRHFQIGEGSGPAPWVVSVPSFVGDSDFDAFTGFWTADPDGGIHATYDNLPQAGIFVLPDTIDLTRPFCFGALFEWNGSDKRCAVRLESTAEPTWRGFSVSVQDGDVRAESGNHGYLMKAADLTPGDLIWMGMSVVDGRVGIWLAPVPHGLYGDPSAYQSSVHQDYVMFTDADTEDGSNGNGQSFSTIDQLAIRTQTDTTRVLAIFARQGDFLSGPDDRIEPPISLQATVNGDENAFLFAPSFVPAQEVRDLVVVFHGAGSSELTGIVADGNTDGGEAITLLRNAGYVIAAMRGTDDADYFGPNATNFGATYPLQHFWRAWIERIKAEFAIRNVYFLGLSMGLVNALNYYRLWPAGIKGIVGISGVSNLSYAYLSENFAGEIDAAYGTSTVGAIAPYDPQLEPADFLDIPIQLWHGDSDATLDIDQHMVAFAAAVNTAGGDVTAHTVVGADHLAADCFDGPAIQAFFEANV